MCLLIVPPTLIQIVDESNVQILNASVLGPLREGHKFISTCEVRGTRPEPNVVWYRGDTKLTGNLCARNISMIITVCVCRF